MAVGSSLLEFRLRCSAGVLICVTVAGRRAALSSVVPVTSNWLALINIFQLSISLSMASA